MLTLCLYSQKDAPVEHVYAFLSEHFVSLYANSVGEKSILLIENTNQDFYLLSLMQKRNHRYFVVLNNISSSDTIFYHGWINRSATGIAFSSDIIELYKKPTEKSQNVQLAIPLGTIVATVLDFKKNGWMKCSFFIDNELFTGWLPNKYQCYNLFTMCCRN